MFFLRLFVLQFLYCCLCYNCCIVNFVLCTLSSGGTRVYQEPFKHSFQWRNWRRKIEWILVCDFRILGSENMTDSTWCRRMKWQIDPTATNSAVFWLQQEQVKCFCYTCTWDLMLFLYIDKQNKWITVNSNITCFELLCIFVHFVVWKLL